jgi:hypothetical protein
VVQLTPTRVKTLFDEVRAHWERTSYSVMTHNCNYFTNACLAHLGLPSIDNEYTSHSGIQPILEIPGISHGIEHVRELICDHNWQRDPIGGTAKVATTQFVMVKGAVDETVHKVLQRITH